MAYHNDVSSARSAVSVTLADTDLARKPTRGVYVGGAGDLKVDMADGTSTTFTAVPAGTLLPIQANRLYATGSTATAVVALY